MKLLYPRTWIRKHREPVSKRRFIWLVVFTVGLALLSGKLGEYWIFQYPNLQVNEWFGGFGKPVTAKRTALVNVDEKDHREYFEGQSPLNAEKLQNAICAVLRSKPAVLVVDFDTSSPSFAKLQVPQTKTRIVWARSIYRFRGETHAGGVLGRVSGEESQGFAASPADGDGAIRSFPREIFVDGKYFATVHWRAVQEFRARQNATLAPAWGTLETAIENLEVARLSNNFQFPQYALRDFSPSTESCTQNSQPNSAYDFEEKVVLFGGNYDFSDTHRNPFEDKWGVEILGSAIEAELSGHSVRHLPFLAKLSLKIVLGSLIGVMFYFLFALPATLLTLAGLTLVVVSGNVAAVFLGGYEGMIVPFVLGVVIEQLVNLVEQAQEAQFELEQMHLAHVGGSAGGSPSASPEVEGSSK